MRRRVSRCRKRLHDWADEYFKACAQVWEDEADEEPRARGSGRHDSHSAGARAGGTAREEAYRVLHLLPSAPQDVVEAVHRVLIKAHHPDCGGNHEDAVRINLAIEEIRRRRG